MKAPDDIESLLRAAKPQPRRQFVEELESRLLPEPRRRQLPMWLAAPATVAALGIVVAVLSIVGTSPTRLGGDRPAKATDECRTVMVEQTQRRPYFVVGRDGDLHLTYRLEQVRRPVVRCR